MRLMDELLNLVKSKPENMHSVPVDLAVGISSTISRYQNHQT